MSKKPSLDVVSLIQKYAVEIATSTAQIIGHDIIITDTDGRIIGASKGERLGDVHEASLAVISTGLSSETTSVQSTQLKGTLPGVTFPICALNGQTVGSMAITGDPKQVRQFGLIVKKQIEILLRERELYDYSANREDILQKLIRDLEFFVPGVSNETMFQTRALEFGYDPKFFYIPIIVDLYQFGRYALEMRQEYENEADQAKIRLLRVKRAVLAELRSTFHFSHSIAAVSGNSRFVELYAVKNASHSDPRSEMIALDTASACCEQLLKNLENYGLKAAIGIGSPALGISALAASYQEARRALQLGKKFIQKNAVYRIADFRVEDLITRIDAPARAQFVKVMTDNLRRKNDWEELSKTIRCWCESGFSLIKTAAALHIHRNSLLYRLDKITQLTGEDIHDFRVCFKLYFALLLSQYSGPALKEKFDEDA